MLYVRVCVVRVRLSSNPSQNWKIQILYGNLVFKRKKISPTEEKKTRYTSDVCLTCMTALDSQQNGTFYLLNLISLVWFNYGFAAHSFTTIHENSIDLQNTRITQKCLLSVAVELSWYECGKLSTEFRYFIWLKFELVSNLSNKTGRNRIAGAKKSICDSILTMTKRTMSNKRNK